MSKWLCFLLTGAMLCAVGCKNEERGSGLPPAEEWNTPVDPGANVGAATGGANPHAAASPHGAMDDPHAGLDMDIGSGDIVEQSGMAAPDPNRPIDASKYLRGTIKATDETKAFIQPGYAIFLSVKPYDPATKGPARVPPLAVDKLESAMVPATFSLTEAQAMVEGTQFVGDVVITAHVSSTGDAMAKVKGDVVGTARAKIPSDGIELVLDTVIP